MSDWINVQDKLPENGQIVLCAGHEWNDKKKPFFMVVSMYRNGFTHYEDHRDDWSSDTSSYFTHWMPLPEPPKEQTND